MQAELDTFPLPEHLTLVDSRSEGPSSCFAGDCPNAIRYYISERSVDETCTDMMTAANDWGAEPKWHRSIERNRCAMSTAHGQDELAISVFPVSRLAAHIAAELVPEDLDRYHAAVLIDLSAP